MALKLTLQGILIYKAMLLYLAALVTLMTGRRKAGLAIYTAGFAAAAAGVIYRWLDTGHVPLQNLFEVFMFLGMLVLPVTLFCRRFLGIGSEKADIIMGIIILFPAGFVFKAEPQKLPPALQSWLFIPHVTAYMVAYVLMAKAGIQAFAQLYSRKGPAEETLVPFETGTYRLVMLGFPILTLGLILGAVWGKIAWSDYWNWDPKELWSLVTWLIYLGYLHFRYMYGTRHARLNSALAIAGSLAIVITLLWVNLSRIFSGLHSYAS